MNSKGRPRLPEAVKKKKGSSRPDRSPAMLSTSVVQMEPLPSAPSMLGAEGKKQWDMLVSQIEIMGISAKVDLLALTAACIEWEAYVKLRAETAEQAAYYPIKDEYGNIKSWQPHPAHYIGTAHLKNFMSIIAKFGFTPSDRMKLNIQTEPPKTSKISGLIKKTA